MLFELTLFPGNKKQICLEFQDWCPTDSRMTQITGISLPSTMSFSESD